MSGPGIDPSLYRERDLVPVRRALIAVSDKRGLVELASALVDAGVEIVSTGGTSKAIADAGLPVTLATSTTSMPASRMSDAEPPVETISTPAAASAFARSSRPALSLTEMSARRIGTTSRSR